MERDPDPEDNALKILAKLAPSGASFCLIFTPT